MFSAIYDIENSKYARHGSYLHEKHFWATVLLALLLHLGGIALYQFLPRDEVKEIPVRVLNIKFGGVPEISQSQIEQAQSFDGALRDFTQKISNAEAIALKEVTFDKPEKALPVVKKVKKKQAPVAKKVVTVKKKKVAPKKIINKPIEKVKQQVEPKRYYRETTRETKQVTAPKEGNSDALGNSLQDSKQLRNNYTRTLSLWMQRHKVYPKEARDRNLGGKVLLRLRINRQGRIVYYKLEESTGHSVIDRGINKMVSAANPVPAVPKNYPDKHPYLEFMIPISFKPN